MRSSQYFISRFLISFIIAVFLSLIFEKIYWLIFWSLYPETILSGGKNAVFIGIFLGIPIGDVIGIIGSEKYYKKINKIRISGLLLAAIFAVIGSFLGLFFSYLVDPWVMLNIISPSIATFAAIKGYDMTLAKTNNKK